MKSKKGKVMGYVVLFDGELDFRYADEGIEVFHTVSEAVDFAKETVEEQELCDDVRIEICPVTAPVKVGFPSMGINWK